MIQMKVDLSKALGKIKPVHGIGNAPIMGANNALFHYLGEAGIPFTRLHDTGGRYGGNVFVDIPNIFRDFDADPEDPAAYDFAFTDWLLNELHQQGVDIVYRLGVTIENFQMIRRYTTFPPKDYEKWARICAGIIRHYNEGWADGFHLNIQYWEIWNEPDNREEPEENHMWMGTAEEYFRFYEVASKYLKAQFPALKFGGYAASGFYVLDENSNYDPNHPKERFHYLYHFFLRFMDYIEAHQCPLDFFSWHHYYDNQLLKRSARFVRKTLDRHGYTATESVLDEWNPQYRNRATPKDAPLVSASILTMQKLPVDLAHFYDGQIYGLFCALFNPITYEPFPTYYGLKFFNTLYRLGTEAAVVYEHPLLEAVAATDGESGALMLANPTDEPLELAIDAGRPPKSYRLIDAGHTDEEMPLPGEVLQMPAQSVVLLQY